MTRAHYLRQIAVTGAVHSHLHPARRLVTTLPRLRKHALIADAGGFFEGSGYYRLGGGETECALLERIYDVIAPGAGGFGHYLREPALRAKTVCANLTDAAGARPFGEVYTTTIAGITTAVTGVIGREAFACVPAAQREGLTALDPAPALDRIRSRIEREGPGGGRRAMAAAMVVLSHCGPEQDLALAERCPYLTAIISSRGPAGTDVRRVGTVQITGPQPGTRGYSIAAPLGADWTVRAVRFDQPRGPVRAQYQDLNEAINALGEQLGQRVGEVRAEFCDRVPEPGAILTHLAGAVLDEGAADLVVLNESLLRPRRLKRTLTRADLLATSPFSDRLVVVQLDDDPAVKLADRLAPVLGPVFTRAASGRAHARVRVATSGYIASTHLGLGSGSFAALPGTVAERVRAVLTRPAMPDGPQPPHPRISEPEWGGQ